MRRNPRPHKADAQRVRRAGYFYYIAVICSNPPKTKTTVKCNVVTPSKLVESYNMKQTIADDFGVDIKLN